jgi:NADH-quinone oxidoreductase subunit M
MVQQVVFGVPTADRRSHLNDLSFREMATLFPLVVLVFWIGFFPNPFLTRMHATVGKLLAGDVERVQTAASSDQDHLARKAKLPH